MALLAGKPIVFWAGALAYRILSQRHAGRGEQRSGSHNYADGSSWFHVTSPEGSKGFWPASRLSEIACGSFRWGTK